MSDEDAAIQAMIDAYKATFKEKPDLTTKMVITASAFRVANGEQFYWVVDGVWRKLVFGEKNV